MAKWTDTGTLTGAQAIDVPPVWLLVMLGLAWLTTVILPALTAVFSVTRVVGGGLVLAGVGLMGWAVTAFHTHQTSVVPHQVPQRIIASGPFARSRNPIYLGDIMVLTGAILWWGSWPALILIPAFIQILVRRFIAPEEARMKESFGADFDEFVKKTPRWL